VRSWLGVPVTGAEARGRSSMAPGPAQAVSARSAGPGQIVRAAADHRAGSTSTGNAAGPGGSARRDSAQVAGPGRRAGQPGRSRRRGKAQDRDLLDRPKRRRRAGQPRSPQPIRPTTGPATTNGGRRTPAVRRRRPTRTSGHDPGHGDGEPTGLRQFHRRAAGYQIPGSGAAPCAVDTEVEPGVLKAQVGVREPSRG